MNQILSTVNDKQKKQRNNFNNLIDMKKIMIIFSILIIAFGLVIASAKIIGLIRNKKNNQETPEVALNQPQITIQEEGSGKVCVLRVSYDEGLEEVTYWWNEENVRKRSLNGQTEPFVTNIEIPQGEENVLHVKAVGVDNSSKSIDYSVGSRVIVENSDKISIKWFHDQETNKITIVARGNDGLKELTYQWEDEEIQKITSTEENQRELKAIIDAKRGTNKITITASDNEGNEQIKEQTIIGALQPTLEFTLINREILRITIKHDMGFKKVTIKINGQQLIYDETNPDYSIETKELNIDVPVKPGKLDIGVSIYTMEQPDQEYKKEGSVNID